MARRKENGLADWFRENALAIIIGLLTMVGGYTAWQVGESTYKTATDQKLAKLQEQVIDNRDEIKQADKELSKLDNTAQMTQQQLVSIEKNEEKLQGSLEKLSESINTLSSSVAGITARQSADERVSGR